MTGVSLITDPNGTPAVLTIDLRTRTRDRLDPANSPLVVGGPTSGLLAKMEQEAEATDRADWRTLAHAALNRAYGEDEPDYSNVPAMVSHE